MEEPSVKIPDRLKSRGSIKQSVVDPIFKVAVIFVFLLQFISILHRLLQYNLFSKSYNSFQHSLFKQW